MFCIYENPEVVAFCVSGFPGLDNQRAMTCEAALLRVTLSTVFCLPQLGLYVDCEGQRLGSSRLRSMRPKAPLNR
jgi:hypothetical protein